MLYRPYIWNLASRLLQISYKLEKWQWCYNLLTRCHHQIFLKLLFLLSSLVSGLSFMLMSLSALVLQQSSLTKDWPEIQKLEIPLFWVLLKIRRLGQVRDTKFDINISNEMLQNASKCYGHSLFLLFLNYLRGTNRWGGGKVPSPWPSHTQG